MFHYVTDCLEDAAGNYFVAEYGDFDRIQKFTKEHQFVTQWGGHGNELGNFCGRKRLTWTPPACSG